METTVYVLLLARPITSCAPVIPSLVSHRFAIDVKQSRTGARMVPARQKLSKQSVLRYVVQINGIVDCWARLVSMSAKPTHELQRDLSNEPNACNALT